MRILVSGAGMAGLSTGITLGAAGHDVAIVERANHLRVNGSPIDIRGDALAVADKMGVLDAIRAHRVDMSERVQFIDASGETLAEMPDSEVNDCPDDTEIPREDLALVLRGALDPATPVTFGESVAALHDDGDGVVVRFTSGRQERYDIVVGADGMHSATRGLVFGPESQFIHHLGFYVALADLPSYAQPDRRNPMYNTPGRMAGIAAYRDKALAVFIFRSPWINYDYHDLAAQKQLLIDAFAGHDEWKIPELLDAAVSDPELYFDSVSQIHMPTWHQGRVVLVGDSAYCASPLSGRGTSLAMTGAWSLAEALRDHPDDIAAAFDQYERAQLPHVTYAQGTAGPGGDRLVPATQQEIDARNSQLSALIR
ncbi:FAD-dependent monooxygenase [Mycolicibacterium helvum]|uniref:Oxidoreductase n=1 Tax=Mycolicibacterium helvum TaxID=1534349 RepID=A0A7I7TAX5_9MYCO|nr:FAD-dependent monooxygenase [Mycolicibacterium helvum]BBY66412.1 oxidoreductase [Mycolicibacterium helvum]